MGYQRKDDSSPELRMSDTPCGDVNSMLEINFKRGFQQGIHFLVWAIKKYPDRLPIILSYAEKIAFSMRYAKRSYKWYGDVFLDKLKKGGKLK